MCLRRHPGSFLAKPVLHSPRQTAGGLGEGFTGFAGRAVKVQTKHLIKTNKGQGPNKTLNKKIKIIIFGNLQHDVILGSVTDPLSRTINLNHNPLRSVWHCWLRAGRLYIDLVNSRLIVTDGVFSMDGNVCPLPQIKELADRWWENFRENTWHSSGVTLFLITS